MSYVDDGKLDFAITDDRQEQEDLARALAHELALAVEKSGLNAYNAKNVPYMLADEITLHNKKNLSSCMFKVFTKELWE